MGVLAALGPLMKAMGPEIAGALSKGGSLPGGVAKVGFGDIFKGKGMENIASSFASNLAGSGQGPSPAETMMGPWAAPFKAAGSVATGAANAFKQDSPFQAGAEFVKALPLGPVSDFGAKLLGSIDGIKAFGNHLNELNMNFSDVSPSMAAVRYEFESYNQLLRLEQGERRAATAEELAQAQTRLNASMAPFEDAWANMRNRIMSPFTDLLADILEEGEPLAELMEDIADAIPPIIAAIREFTSTITGVIRTIRNLTPGNVVGNVVSRITGS